MLDYRVTVWSDSTTIGAFNQGISVGFFKTDIKYAESIVHIVSPYEKFPISGNGFAKLGRNSEKYFSDLDEWYEFVEAENK